MKLPAQAIPGRLAQIQPSKNSTKWDPRARDRLLGLVGNRELTTLVRHVDPVSQSCFLDRQNSQRNKIAQRFRAGLCANNPGLIPGLKVDTW